MGNVLESIFVMGNRGGLSVCSGSPLRASVRFAIHFCRNFPLNGRRRIRAKISLKDSTWRSGVIYVFGLPSRRKLGQLTSIYMKNLRYVLPGKGHIPKVFNLQTLLSPLMKDVC